MSNGKRLTDKMSHFVETLFEREIYAGKMVVSLSEASKAVMETTSRQESLQPGLNTDASD